MKTKVIGHRGAAGLATENTLESIKAALDCGVNMIEIDVRATADDILVLSHDETLTRTFNVDLAVHEHNLKRLRSLCPNLPTLDEAFKLAGKTPLVIEIKASFDPELLFKVIDKYPNNKAVIASFNHEMLKQIKKLRPHIFVYVLEHHSPFEIITRARAIKANGVGYNFSLVNPLTYWLTRRHKLSIYAYTINHPLNGWFIKTFYPRVAICTDFPNRFTKK